MKELLLGILPNLVERLVKLLVSGRSPESITLDTLVKKNVLLRIRQLQALERARKRVTRG